MFQRRGRGGGGLVWFGLFAIALLCYAVLFCALLCLRRAVIDWTHSLPAIPYTFTWYCIPYI